MSIQKTAPYQAISVGDQLCAIGKLAKKLFTQTNYKTLLRTILSDAVHLTYADRGSIFLLQDQQGTICSCLALGVEEEIQLDAFKGVVGEVIQEKKLINIKDAYQDHRFYPEIDKLTGYRTKSIVCAPILTSDGKMLGAIELLNTKRGEFNKEDESVLLILSIFSAIAVEHQNQIDALTDENIQLKKRLFLHQTGELIGTSQPINEIKEMIYNISAHSSNVIITGESGTGKEIAANLIHKTSPQAQGPFLALNCAAIPEALLESELFGIEQGVATGVTKRQGKFEQANGGTLFLDELGDMSLLTQAKLLRAIQEHVIEPLGSKEQIHVDVRILAATNKNLKEEITAGRFREDLYYRLNVIEMHLPALRERLSDIPFLIEHFLRRHNAEGEAKGIPAKKMDPYCVELMLQHGWPGNIRQLENKIEKAYILSGNEVLIKPHHLGKEFMAPTTHKIGDKNGFALGEAGFASQATADIIAVSLKDRSYRDVLDEVERALLLRTLQNCQGNKSQTAKILSISREGLRKMFIRLDIK